jgi:secreted PhoX family phosphatase
MNVVSLKFEELSLPANPEEEKMMRVSPAVLVTYDDGRVERHPLSYVTLYKSGDKDAQGNAAGQLFDKDGRPITFADGSPRFSVQADATAFFERGGKIYALQHFESSPGAVYLVEHELTYDKKLKAVKFKNVDFSKVGGTVINCSAQKSPWDTFLSAEEDYYFSSYHFDPATKDFNAQHVEHCERDANGKLTGNYRAPSFAPTADFKWWCSDFVKPLITDYLKTTIDKFNPYNYGYIVEIAVDNSGNAVIPNNMKLYTMGKFTPEVAVVMPDKKTVYMLDDGAWTGMFMFVADKEGDLNAGTLYVAKMNQQSPDDTDGGNFKVDWIRLGSAKNSELKAFIDKGVKMSDIFDMANPSNCPSQYSKIYTYDSSDAKTAMCVRLRDGSNGSTISSKFANADEVRKAAAFLNPRQYGALLGGTLEFSKGEGVTYDKDRNRVYFAISRVEESMLKGKGTTDTQDDIRIKANKCGVIYEGIFGTATDRSGSPINSSYVVRDLATLLKGTELKVGDPGADKNACALNNISNPDNILYLGKDLLLIAEDSGFHFNNMLWVYNLKDKSLTRIGTVPPGAEVTGAFAHVNIGDFKYIAFNAQHPYGESRRNAAGASVPTGGTGSLSNENLKDEKYKAIVGYIHGLPQF